MGSYTHLDLDERRKLYQLTSAGRSPRQAAAELGRHPSTIYRELKRNHRFDEEPMFRGYFPLTAQSMAAGRRLRGAKISRYPELASYIVDRLEAAWSPEQIAGYLRHRTAGLLRVSHETIYQFVYGRDGQAAKLAQLLPTGRRKRRRRYARKPRGLNIPPAHTIAARPPDIAERANFGHWEGDLIAFKLYHGKANLTSLVERRSRFTVLTPNSSRHSAGIMEGIERHLGTLPPSLRRTITLDRGTEFACYRRLRESLGMTAYFCQPSVPWQKGSVENNNGRVRRLLPSDTDIAQVPRAELEQLVDRLNRTPRKCLAYRTPGEVLAEQVALVLEAEPSRPGMSASTQRPPLRSLCKNPISVACSYRCTCVQSAPRPPAGGPPARRTPKGAALSSPNHNQRNPPLKRRTVQCHNMALTLRSSNLRRRSPRLDSESLHGVRFSMDDASPTPQIRFLTLAKSEYVPRTGANLVVLGYDDWDDWFEFETTHTVHIFDGAGQQFKIGGVKIGEAGQKGRRPTLPREFAKLDDRFFSVGLSEDFYKALADLGLSEQVLVGLNDLAYNLNIFERYKDERVATVSLFRTIDSERIINKFHRLAHGNAELTDYSFEYVLDEDFSSDDGAVITFDVRPNSKPPSNVHTLIGRNGVGKTTLLNNIVRSYVDSLKTHAGAAGGSPSRLRISSDASGGSFANLVSVTFSAFDPFFTESTPTKGRYSYIGLKESLSDAKRAAIESTNIDFRIKNPEDLTSDFINSARICLDHPKRRRWTQALEDLAADPIFEESEIIELSSGFASIEDWRDDASRVFRRLSSGHKIVLLTITRLVELVEERSLVLLDEPESHLHPPLLSAFIRALSSLLSAQNGVAIVATHSPVVLQETPKSCAWILDRSGNTARARRPVQETFGENVALLTHEVFGLEVTETGFYELLRKEVARLGNYDAIMAELEGQLGTEAIAIVRALLPKEKVRVR